MLLPDAGVTVAIAGARQSDGSDGAANPEELLLGALAACFANTWAIFLKKLQIGYADPTVAVSGRLEDDPAGGFRVTDAVIRAQVPLRSSTPTARRSRSRSRSPKYCVVARRWFGRRCRSAWKSKRSRSPSS